MFMITTLHNRNETKRILQYVHNAEIFKIQKQNPKLLSPEICTIASFIHTEPEDVRSTIASVVL